MLSNQRNPEKYFHLFYVRTLYVRLGW